MAKNRMVQQPKGFIRGFSAIHRAWLKLTGGRVGNKFHGEPIVLLTTKGRKTGKERTWPLLSLRDGDAYVFAASYGGHDHHPAWYLNLEANPDVTIKDKGATATGHARITSGAERATWYARFVETYKAYGDYAEATDREIPIVIVEPRAR